MKKVIIGVLIMLFSALGLFLLDTPLCSAQQLLEETGDKQALERAEESIFISVNAHIIEGKSIIRNGETWIEVDLIQSIVTLLGGEASYHKKGHLFAMSGLAFKQDSKPAFDGAGNFRLIIDGDIYHVPCQETEEDVFLSVHTLEAVLYETNMQIQKDPAKNLMTISPLVTEKPLSKLEDQEKAAGGDKPPASSPVEEEKAVKDYMESLKRVFQRHNPKRFNIGRLEEIILEAGLTEDINPDIFKNLKDQQMEFLKEIKKLSPPNQETKEIQDLAVSVLSKMIDILDICEIILTLPKNQENPEAQEQLIKLYQEMGDEEALFNQKVRDVRNRYKMPPP